MRTRCSTDLPRRRPPADRVRPAARRAVGHFRVRLQHDRSAHDLSVPGVRRARAGAEARPGRGPGDRALCQRPGADGGAGGGLPQPASVWRPTASKAPTASTKRSTTRPRGCRRAPSSVTVRQFMAHHEGMSLLSLAYVLLDKPMQRRFLADPDAAGGRPAAAGARSQGDRAGLPPRARSRAPRASPRPKKTGTHARLHRSRTARRRKSICSPTAATTSPSPAPAAATAAGATWR